MKDEMNSLPLTLRQVRTGIQKISEDELRVHLSERQLEWLASRMNDTLGSFKLSLVLILLSFFLLLLDPAYQSAAILFFTLGALRLLYRS
jgi:hypothetical protein